MTLASIGTSLALPQQISKKQRAGQTHLSSRGNRRRKVAAGLDLLASESAGPKPGRRGWRHLFSHIGGRREARTKSLDRSVHQPVRKQRRAKLENEQARRTTSHRRQAPAEGRRRKGAEVTARGNKGHGSNQESEERRPVRRGEWRRRAGDATSRQKLHTKLRRHLAPSGRASHTSRRIASQLTPRRFSWVSTLRGRKTSVGPALRGAG